MQTNTITRLKYHLLRLVCFINALVFQLALQAQGLADDDDFSEKTRNLRRDIDEEMDQIEYTPIHITLEDILWIVLVFIACLVFRKIWKGCSFIIIVFAFVFYYLIRH